MTEEMKNALKESRLITDNNTVITKFSGDALKTVCIDGSTNIGDTFWINNNSELICKPIIEYDKKSIFSKRTNKIPDDEFFYSGIQLHRIRNASLRMGLGAQLFNHAQAESIHFIGRGLLIKTTGNNDIFNRLTFQQTVDEYDSNLIRKWTLESLFPYHSGSIPDPVTHKPLYESQSNIKNGGTTTSAPATSTNTISSKPDTINPLPPAPESTQSGNIQEINPNEYN